MDIMMVNVDDHVRGWCQMKEPFSTDVTTQLL